MNAVFPAVSSEIVMDLLKRITPPMNKIIFVVMRTPCVEAQISLFKPDPTTTSQMTQLFTGSSVNCYLEFIGSSLLVPNTSYFYKAVSGADQLDGSFMYMGGEMKI